MTFTNIHVAPPPPSSILNPPSSLPRLRRVTNDPAREYAQRPGQVERLPDSIAQMILSKKGYSQVTRNGIRVEGITPKPLVFWSEHSVTIAEKAGTNDKVLWVLNRLNPDVIHILKPSGEYVESIPLDEKAEWFNQDHLKILGAKRRSQQRSIDRVAGLHAPDSEAAVAAATANDTAMKSIVHTFPSPAKPDEPRRSPAEAGSLNEGGRISDILSPRDRSPVSHERNSTERIDPENTNRAGPFPPTSDRRSPTSGTFGKAERLHQIQRHIDGRRKSHEDREHARSNASRFGAASKFESASGGRNSKIEIPQPSTSTEIEEW